LEVIERVMDRDHFMDVNQAMKFGIIDKVLDKRNRDDDEDSAVNEKSKT
jgi:ATP-dependent protease ClpP protease subunit